MLFFRCSHTGSEEENDEDTDSDDDRSEPLVPRGLRIFFQDEEEEEDTPLKVESTDPLNVESTDLPEEAPRGEDQGHQLYDFHWREFPSPPISPSLRREEFTENVGPTIEPPSHPYEAFVKIWDRPIMEHIASQTNLYAQQYANRLLERGEMGPKSRIASWTDTDVDELYTYFALVIAMGIIVKTKLENYWSADKTIFATPGFSVQMSLRRFQLLSRCLHFNDNDNFSSNTLTSYGAKIFKIQPIVDHLNSKFSSLYRLGQNISLDESLTQWKGRLGIKQFIPNKAATVGIKTYEVCDSKTGYLWRFELYTGSEREAEQEPRIGVIPNLVLRLLRGLGQRGHTVWMDNYYNSPVLARVLKCLGFDCVGTLRTNRQYVPEQIANWTKYNMQMGEVRGCTSGDVDLIVWRDRNRVAMISTYHGVAVSGDKPDVIKDYNVCMGGVDRKDQMLAMYPMERKRTRIWYKKTFRRLLNVSVLNAYILHKHFTSHIQHRDFRMCLVTEILQRHNKRPEISLGPPRDTHVRVPKFSAEVLAHFPSELPILPGGNKAGKYRRQCVVCKKRTFHFCKACNVSLCFSPASSCYIIYHT